MQIELQREQERTRRLIDLLATTSREIGVSLNSHETLTRALALSVRLLADAAVFISIGSDGALICTKIVHGSAEKAAAFQIDVETRFEVLLEKASVKKAIRSGEPCVSEDLKLLTLPVRERGEIAGVLCLFSESDRTYLPPEVTLCAEFADRFGVALGNARIYEDLRNAEAELTEARQAAEQASRAKSSFLAHMSHEIRTPLTAILGFSELLAAQAAKTPENDEFAARIRQNGEHLMRIIDDILNLAKVESGKLQLDLKETDLPKLLSNLQSVAKESAKRKGLEFNLKFESRLPMNFKTDPTRLNQILLNLISNAVKFTSSGLVEVLVDYKPRSGCLAFSVTDTGPGLSEDQTQKLFQPFSQGDTLHSRSFGGTGLGLVLSRKLAKALGGDVSLIKTTPGGGTTFEVTLPIHVGPSTSYFTSMENDEIIEAKAHEAESFSLKGRKVLLVDDSEDNRLLVSRMLTGAGAEVTEAHGGREAISIARENKFSIVLMDVQMPEVDGLMATKELRKLGYTGPIVSLTAHALNEEREACIEAGCDGHLTKPVSKLELFNVVAHWSAHSSRYLRG